MQNSSPKSIFKNQMWFRHGQECHICHCRNTLQKCTFMESSNVIYGPL